MSEQLALALKAGIPMVRVATDDEINATDILAALTDKEVDPWDGRTPATTRHGNKVVWIFGHNREAVDKISPEFYNQALNANMTFVLINGVEDDWSWALDCGVMSPPESMIADVLEQMLNPADAKKFARFFLGMSVKQVIETVMLTQARDKIVSAAGINQTKSYLGRGLPGLEAVDPKQDFYVAPPWADEWLEVEAPLIQKSKYRDLWPRGFMLHGPPGTGKTELAKYIASKLNYPLFRLDAGSLYSRWQGDTEARLRNVLSFIDGQGECVFLIDEAEKLFGNEALGQASQSTMQGMLLWWLQSNSNKAVTVMTANSLETIPPALYREGRLDAVHKMEGVKKHLADIFAKQIVPSFAKYGVDPHSLSKAVGNRLSELANATFSQATVVGLVRAEAKRLLFQEPKEGS